MSLLDKIFGRKEPKAASPQLSIEEYRELFKSLKKSSILLEPDNEFNGESPIGRSKIGGKPDLPADFVWPRYEGEHFDGSEKVERPLSFIAQINCADASKHDKSALLPTSGMLYFFYDMASGKWGFDPNDKGCAKVFYHAGDVSELYITELPDDLLSEPYNFRIPEAPVCFSIATEVPDFEEFVQLSDNTVDYDLLGEYMDAAVELEYKIEEDAFEKSKLLGYADLVQSGMLLECECATNGIYCGDESSAKEMEQRKTNGKQWQLLFQLGSFHIGDYELMWGDMGRIYYYIKVDDLEKLKFDDCWLILQCG